MSYPRRRASCSLHVFIYGAEPRRPDPSGLVAAIGDRLRTVTVFAWCEAGDDLDLATVERAREVIDDLEDLTGFRPEYVELQGVLGSVIEQHLGADRYGSGEAVVALVAGAPKRILRTLRGTVGRRSGTHVALVPASSGSPRELAGR